MAMHPLVKRLRALSPDVFSPGVPAEAWELRQLERAVGHRFPEDYRACLLEFGNFEIFGPAMRMTMYTISDVLVSLDDEVISPAMPGIVTIASDEGGFAFYYDPTDQLGRGKFAVFLVGYGTLTFEKSRFVAPTLTGAIDELLAGAELRMRDPVGRRPRRRKR